MSTINNLDVQLLLLEIEDLFDRFRNLSHDAKGLIFEEIKFKLSEEFKDFMKSENDLNQETVYEIIFNSNSTENAKLKFPQSIENCDLDSSECPKDLLSLFESRNISQVEPKIINESLKVDTTTVIPDRNIQKKKNFSETCNYCGKVFLRKNLLNVHIQRHKNERFYECATCALQFNVKDDLVKHIKSHSSIRSYICSICSKSLVNKTVLRNHIQIMHRKEEKYFCDKCDYFAFCKQTLNGHVRIKHTKLHQKYACVICRSVFITKVSLKVHLRSHTGEKPYKCQNCDAAFVSSGQLTNHKNSVHGERKYNCEICNKSFKTTCKLKRHSFIHTRIKPFTCPFCTNYASNTQGNLTKHVKTIHQMNDFSYLKYKKMMRGELEDVKEEWIKNAELFTNEYLKNLFNENGTVLSIEELKQRYLGSTKNKQICN